MSINERVREDFDEAEVPVAPLRPVQRSSGELTADDKQWAMFCHLSCLAGFIFPGGNIIGPLVCWMMKKENSPFVDYHGKESLNFQLNLMVAILICMFTIIGIPVAMVLGVVGLIMPVMAGMKANEGEYYEYPYIVRVIK